MTLFLDVISIVYMNRGATTVAIHGYALREIRKRSGIEQAQLAQEIDVTDAYIRRIELGHSKRVSATVYTRILSALGIQDQRVLLAQPHPDQADLQPSSEGVA